MKELRKKKSKLYEVIPELNNNGRLCNYHTGTGETVKVPADEWERFNRLAGRQHKIVDGIVVYDETLELCLTDEELQTQIDDLKEELAATDYKVIKCNEYKLAGQKTPYNVSELHKERESLRQKIKQLEGQDILAAGNQQNQEGIRKIFNLKNSKAKVK